ncbi:MAG: hypothetical protein PHF86_08650 [Candidatus Nanoarchaeia archaeon]|jgi:hypothetical protein|nr:hypothetical protein [Candidatus Nanoarchaeia archaeon]
MSVLDHVLIGIIWILFLILVYYQKKSIEDLQLHLKYLTKGLRKQQNLLDLVASALCNPAARSLYSRLSEIKIEDYPDDNKTMSELIEKFSHENYTKQRKILLDLIEKTEDPAQKSILQKKLEKFDELKTVTSLLDHDSSDEYKKTLIDNIDKIIFELYNNEEEEDDDT